MNVDELKIKDAEFESAGQDFNSFCRLLDNAISGYNTCLKNVSSKGIMSGSVHEALNVYMTYVERLVGIPANLGKQVKKLTNLYINDIDKADEYLYEKGGSVVRDFSNDEYKKLISLLDDPWCNVTDGIGDWIIGKCMKWFGAYDVKSSKSDIDACHKKLLDYNDATKKTIDGIFNNVKTIDKHYGRSIAGATPLDGDYYTSSFDNAALCLFNIRDALNEMAEIINPGSGKFSAEQIRNSLELLFQDIERYHNQVVNIVATETGGVTIEQIEDFLSYWWSASVFDCFLGPITMFLADIGGKETAMMVIFNMFDIAEGQIVSQGEYEKLVVKEELMELLDEMAETYEYQNSDEQGIIDNCSDFLKYVKKYGDKWYEYMNTHRGENGRLLLDGRTKEAKAFKKMLDSLGGAKKILEYGDDAIDVISKIFVDYSKNLELLDSFMRNNSGNDNMSECAKEIQKLYNKELEGIFNEALDKIKEVGFGEAMKWLGKKIPPVAVVKSIDKIIGEIGEVTQTGDQSKSMFNALIYQDMYYSAEDSFQSALKKVKDAIENGNNSGKEYEGLVQDLRNCFNITKNTLIKMFKAMAASTTGNKKAYYEYCANRAESMTMIVDYSSVPDKPHILSYEEYLKM